MRTELGWEMEVVSHCGVAECGCEMIRSHRVVRWDS